MEENCCKLYHLEANETQFGVNYLTKGQHLWMEGAGKQREGIHWDAGLAKPWPMQWGSLEQNLYIRVVCARQTTKLGLYTPALLSHWRRDAWRMVWSKRRGSVHLTLISKELELEAVYWPPVLQLGYSFSLKGALGGVTFWFPQELF